MCVPHSILPMLITYAFRKKLLKPFSKPVFALSICDRERGLWHFYWRNRTQFLDSNFSFFSLSLFLLYLCPTNETAAAAQLAAAAMFGATGGQVQPMSAVNIGALGGGAGGPQMMATPFGMIGTAPRFR